MTSEILIDWGNGFQAFMTYPGPVFSLSVSYHHLWPVVIPKNISPQDNNSIFVLLLMYFSAIKLSQEAGDL